MVMFAEFVIADRAFKKIRTVITRERKDCSWER
jgi:hypothetical protein